MENTKKTIVQIIDENTFVKDGLITVENAIKCAELYASQFKQSDIHKYLKNRCKLAENVIENSKCYDEYVSFIAGGPIPEEEIRDDKAAILKSQPVNIQWLSEEEIEDKYPCKNRIHPNSITHEKQQDACKWLQSQLQSRVNAVDEKQVLISFCGWLFGLLCDETEQRIVNDYLTSKTK